MIEEPQKAQMQLESNIVKMPSNVHVVRRIALGHEHLVALVELKGLVSHPEAMFGMGSNLYGQLGKDPFKNEFMETLV